MEALLSGGVDGADKTTGIFGLERQLAACALGGARKPSGALRISTKWTASGQEGTYRNVREGAVLKNGSVLPEARRQS